MKAELSPEEEFLLAQSWRVCQDQEALNDLVRAHIWLVITIARRFHSRNSTLPLGDLIQEGNVALLVAARRFDPGHSSRARFRTYAAWWISAYVLEASLRAQGPVRIGSSSAQRRVLFHMTEARRRLEAEGVDVTTEALAEALGTSTTVVQALATRKRDVALDDTDTHMALEDTGPTPEDAAALSEFASSGIERGLRALDPRERAIVRHRHLRQHPATLGALGRKFGISRERVRQLEARALNKMRAAVVGRAAGDIT